MIFPKWKILVSQTAVMIVHWKNKISQFLVKLKFAEQSLSVYVAVEAKTAIRLKR